jgi:uncharacterized caspase-like protein
MGSYAFVVGVNNYVQKPDGLATLGGAVRDSDDFVDWLKEQKDADEKELFTDQNIFHIKSMDDVLAPSLNDAQNKLADFITELQNNVDNEKLYFYFAGHGVGHPDEVDQNLLCLSDWTKLFSANSLASVPAVSFFRFLSVFKEIVFIFDCCRTRYIRARHNEFIIPNIRFGNTTDASVYIAYSTSYDDEAHEYDTKGNNGTLEKRGVFTKVLLEGLRGAAADENGDIDHDSLSTYLIKEVNTQAQKAGFSQKPQCSVILANGNERILFKSIPVVQMKVTFNFTVPGFYILNDSKDKLVNDGMIDASVNTTNIRKLSKGYYTLIRDSDKTEKIFRVTDTTNAITF